MVYLVLGLALFFNHSKVMVPAIGAAFSALSPPKASLACWLRMADVEEIFLTIFFFSLIEQRIDF